MYISFRVKYPLCLSDFNDMNFLNRISKNIKTRIFMKILPVEAQLFHADRRTDGQTDMMKLIVAFRSFAKAPKKRLIFKIFRSLL